MTVETYVPGERPVGSASKVADASISSLEMLALDVLWKVSQLASVEPLKVKPDRPSSQSVTD